MINCEGQVRECSCGNAQTHSLYPPWTHYELQSVSCVNIIPDIPQVSPEPVLLCLDVASELLLQRLRNKARADSRLQARHSSVYEIKVFVGVRPIRGQNAGHDCEHFGYQLADFRLVDSN